ncbi:hypothetical protein DYY88_19230 [Leptolyngbya iicbica LK]|uniref:Uncharacterized protein n=1 Tax=Leptolyngbya iicbica LK TaxID=2294035 RepID=A0A4Q7E3I3_9CYAN|nr:hypothetical protein DYY88_19230 [Leptolyngbya sp. LK]
MVNSTAFSILNAARWGQIETSAYHFCKLGPHPPTPSPKTGRRGAGQVPLPALGEGFRVRVTKLGCTQSKLPHRADPQQSLYLRLKSPRKLPLEESALFPNLCSPRLSNISKPAIRWKLPPSRGQTHAICRSPRSPSNQRFRRYGSRQSPGTPDRTNDH